MTTQHPRDTYPSYDGLPNSTKTLVDEIQSVTNTLASGPVSRLRTNIVIPISHFNYFAPYHLGVKRWPTPDQIKSPADDIFRQWCACVNGMLQHDVSVVRDGTTKELFIVPSHIESDSLEHNTEAVGGKSIRRIQVDLDAEQNFKAIARDTALEHTYDRISRILNGKISDEYKKERAEMWAKIYDFYKVDIKSTLIYQDYLKKKNENKITTSDKEQPKQSQSEDVFGEFPSDF